MSSYIGYIGNGASGKSSGIHVVTADENTGALSLLQHMENIDSPSYLAISKNENLLVCGKTNQKAPSPLKAMTACFSIAKDGRLTFLNDTPSASFKSPCHVHISNDTHFVYASHYVEGQISVYALADNLKIWGPIQIISHNDRKGLAISRVHYGFTSPDEKYICFCDLGLDIIRLYSQEETGLLTYIKDIPVVAGAGARHLVFSHDGRFCYVVSEMGCLLTTYLYNNGEFKLVNTISTLADEGNGEKAASAIRISPDGSLLFVGNRFVNNIAVFTLEEDGIPHLCSNIECEFPRDLNILPNGKFLYVCGQKDHSVQIFAVDYRKKSLIPTEHNFNVEAPTCIEFLSGNFSL